MNDFGKLLALLYEASQEADENYPREKIEEFLDETREAMLLKELSDRNCTNIEVKYGIDGEPMINIKYPLLTYDGIKVAEELLKPAWKKLRFKPVVNSAILLSLVGLFLTIFINLDKIENNYHKYISSGRLVNVAKTHVHLK